MSSYNFQKDIPSKDEWQENKNDNNCIDKYFMLNVSKDATSGSGVGDDLDVHSIPFNGDSIDEELEENENEELRENEEEYGNEDEYDYVYMGFDYSLNV
ncbi:unnamed protein product [Vicia faba]|uniref:Uncharacterized protein n=1 Tax=Vicia faba TaxID=3906 RepID=A0AAV0Z858_VICFA|nr:unnamed protein product [Vicia faba]